MRSDKYGNIGVAVPEVLLPKDGIDMTKWATVACDQYTSQPDYWEEVERVVGDAPSTFRITYPEIFLEEPDKPVRIRKIHAAMEHYLKEGVFTAHDGAIYMERMIGGVPRAGLVIALDLECYDFAKGSQTLIRATEGTVIERIPPRVEIRDGAPLELPHIMVLIDDPKRTVIEPLEAMKANAPLYDFDLMMQGGHISGWSVDDDALDRALSALTGLADKDGFMKRYDVGPEKGVLLFAMGDGNHSLATAKTVWEQHKHELPANHPLRYALVELVNVHSSALVFEPIHRVVFGLKKDVEAEARSFFGAMHVAQVADRDAMEKAVSTNDGTQKCGFVDEGGFFVWTFEKPTTQLAVGTLQQFLDKFMKEGGAEKIDYIHGTREVCDMGAATGNCGFFLAGMDKNDLFKTVIKDGALPRKTFSMGEAHEKRFYLECRKIA